MWVGDVRTDKAIPYVRYERGTDETNREFMTRMAIAARFAFRIDPEAYDDDFEFAQDLFMLSNGILSRCWISGHFAMESDRALIEESGADQLFIYFFERGHADMSPTRTGLRIGKGDILVMDAGQPGKLDQYDTINIRLIVPRHALGADFGDRDVHGCVIPASAPLAGILGVYASRLLDDAPRMAMSDASHALDAMLRLIAHELGERYDRRLPQVSLRDRCDALIQANLARSDLSASWLAQRLGVGRATLYRAFENLGGVRGYIVARRMIHAWPRIVDQPEVPLAEIAEEAGFRTRAAMSRAFAELTGAPVEAVRAMAPAERADAEMKLTLRLIRTWELRLGRKLDPAG